MYEAVTSLRLSPLSNLQLFQVSKEPEKLHAASGLQYLVSSPMDLLKLNCLRKILPDNSRSIHEISTQTGSYGQQNFPSQDKIPQVLKYRECRVKRILLYYAEGPFC